MHETYSVAENWNLNREGGTGRWSKCFFPVSTSSLVTREGRGASEQRGGEERAVFRAELALAAPLDFLCAETPKKPKAAPLPPMLCFSSFQYFSVP